MLADAFGSMLDQTVILSIITEIMTATGAVLLVVIMARIEVRASARDEEIRAQLAPAPLPVPEIGWVPGRQAHRPAPVTSVPQPFSPATTGVTRASHRRRRRCPGPLLGRAARAASPAAASLIGAGRVPGLPRSLSSLCQPTLQSRRGLDARCRSPRMGPIRSREAWG